MTSLLLRRAPGRWGVLVEMGVVGVALLANLLARWLTLDDFDVAVAHAHALLEFQTGLGLDWEHAAQDGVEAVPWVGSFASWFYVWGYLPVVALTLVALFIRRPRDYAFLRNALLAGGVVGLPVYVLWPVAPPRLSDLGYADTVAASVLEGAARPVGIANEIAAMPSFHVGYLVVVSAVVWRLLRSPVVRAWCVLHPLVMCWAVLATGNHWVLDLPAGVLLAIVGLGVARWVKSRAGGAGTERSRRPGHRRLPRARRPLTRPTATTYRQLEIHLGVEAGLKPQKKADPGLLVCDIDALAQRLTEHDWPSVWGDDFPGMRRYCTENNNGNRLEFLQPK